MADCILPFIRAFGLVYTKYLYYIFTSKGEAPPLEDVKHAIRINQKALEITIIGVD